MYSFEGERFGRIGEGQRLRTAASKIRVWRHGPPKSRKGGPAMCPAAEASAWIDVGKTRQHCGVSCRTSLIRNPKMSREISWLMRVVNHRFSVWWFGCE